MESSYQWAASGRHISMCGICFASRHLTAPSRYKNNIQSSIVGRQNPLSVAFRMSVWRGRNIEIFQYCIEWRQRSYWIQNGNEYLPACQTYCTHTYVLARKSSQLTGIKNRHTTSDVIAIITNRSVNACNRETTNDIMSFIFLLWEYWDASNGFSRFLLLLFY